MMPLEDCRRLLDAAIENRRPIDADELIQCLRTARSLRARGFPEGARSIDDRIREHGGLLCEHGRRLDRFCEDCGL